MTWTSVRPDSPASESQPYLPLSTAAARSTTREDTNSGKGEAAAAAADAAAGPPSLLLLLLAAAAGAGFRRRLRRTKGSWQYRALWSFEGTLYTCCRPDSPPYFPPKFAPKRSLRPRQREARNILCEGHVIPHITNGKGYRSCLETSEILRAVSQSVEQRPNEGWGGRQCCFHARRNPPEMHRGFRRRQQSRRPRLNAPPPPHWSQGRATPWTKNDRSYRGGPFPSVSDLEYNLFESNRILESNSNLD